MQKSNAKCKKCKRIKEKVFLKGEKCNTPKCPLVKAAANSTRQKKGGMMRRRRKNVSEYGLQLLEKQKVKFSYGLREKQFKNYVKKVTDKSGSNMPMRLFGLLESRLDNAVFRLGLASSRSLARQMVSHGHIMVNGKKMDIPSHMVKEGDKIGIRPQSASSGNFKDIDIKLKKYSPPAWISLDKDKKEGTIAAKPTFAEEPAIESSLVTIIEFYSR